MSLTHHTYDGPKCPKCGAAMQAVGACRRAGNNCECASDTISTLTPVTIMLNLQRYSNASTTSLVNLDADAPPPSEFGFPDRYTEWRHNQYAAIERILLSEKRFVAICAPTGFGKAGVVMGAAAMSGRRCGVLTMTKGLQDQYGEFAHTLSDIRGLANYACPIAAQLGVPAHTTVAEAPCQCGYQCRLRRTGECSYFARYRGAQHADIFCTNYACWLHDSLKQPEQHGNLQFGVDAEITGDRPVGILFCDECHSLNDALSMFIGIDLSRKECLSLHLPWPDAGGGVDDWKLWAGMLVEPLAERLKDLETRLHNGNSDGRGRSTETSAGWSKEVKHLRDMKRKLDRLATVQADDEWIITETDVNESARTMSSVRFDPLNPARHAESALFRGIEKIVLVSATVRPKTAQMLGIDPGELEFVEYPSTFPKERRPIIHVPSIRMTYTNEQNDDLMTEWLAVFDEIVGSRLAVGWKGIAHCVSYRRARFIADNSKHKSHMLIHSAHDRASVIDGFKRSNAACVLLSPSVDTGYDFPGELCRFQIIVKLPFGSVTDPVIKARKAKDQDYDLYQTAQTLVQMTGRPVRCFDLSTEILTTDGWKKYSDIRVGDMTYGVRSIHGKRPVRRGTVTVEENPVLAVRVNTTAERVLRLYSSKGVDIVVTPDHEMLAQLRVTSKYRRVSSSGLAKIKAVDLPCRFKIISAGRLRRKGQYIGKNFTWAIDWFRLMGIIISDGHVAINKSTITIIQSKPHNKAWIQGVIDRLKLKTKIYELKRKGTPMQIGAGKTYTRNHNTIHWVISGTDAARIRDIFDKGARRRHSEKKKYRKRRHQGTHGYAWVDGWKDIEKTIPRWVLTRASTNQMRAMLEGLMLGDGTERIGGGTYYTSSSDLADRLQEMLALSGFRSSICTRRGQHEVNFCTKGSIDCVRSTTVSEWGEAKTWCVNTRLGTVIARRNGKTFLAGNSETDWAETFILDDSLAWAYPRMRMKGFLPRWWQSAFTSLERVPEPVNFSENSS